VGLHPPITANAIQNQAPPLLSRKSQKSGLAGSGDIIPDRDTLHIRLDPLPAPRHTAAIDELCHALNDTNTVCPGTDLTLRYSIKSHQ